jgi:hypothetical protein
MKKSNSLSADWTQVLAHVETALAKAVDHLAEREQSLASSQRLQIHPSLDFSKFEERMARFSAFPQPAEQRLAQLDAELAQGEDALRKWLGRAETTRKSLAAWVGRAIR